MSFAIIGQCGETSVLGAAVMSSSPAVAARCAHAGAGVGAVATQSSTDPRLGPHTRTHGARRDGARGGKAAHDLRAIQAFIDHCEDAARANMLLGPVD
jgi:uncharacterized Ntn-hydrolase superfamily protein